MLQLDGNLSQYSYHFIGNHNSVTNIIISFKVEFNHYVFRQVFFKVKIVEQINFIYRVYFILFKYLIIYSYLIDII